MGIIESIVLGLVQGLTEFLPISSTAHLRIIPALVGWDDPGAAFTAIIQLGTVAAVLLYFAKDIKNVLVNWWRSVTGKGEYDKSEARMAWAVIIGSIPIIIVGLALKSTIETRFRSLYIIAASLIVMGVVMLIADRTSKGHRQQKDVKVADGVIVGLWQVLAVIPGMSRSGSTISGALFQKFDRVAAARFSFLLSIPSVAGAGLYEGYKTLKEAKLPQEAGESAAAFASRQIHWAPTIVATIVAFIVGYISIAFFLKFLGKHGIAPFVWYRVALGLLIFALVGGNLIKADVGANTSLQAKPDVVQQQP